MRHLTSCIAAATALTTALVVVPAGTAAADDVIAYGRNVGGICHFEETIDYAGGAMRADADCRLLRVPETSLSTLRTPPARRAKAARAAAATAGPGAGLGGTLSTAGSTAGAVTSAGDGLTHYEGFARWTYWDDDGNVAVHDELTIQYDQTEQDGTFFGTAPTAAYCATGPMRFPTVVTIDECWWQQGIPGGHTVSFSSGGTYTYRVLAQPVLTIELSMNYVHLSDGRFVPHCDGPQVFPAGWTTNGCSIGYKETTL